MAKPAEWSASKPPVPAGSARAAVLAVKRTREKSARPGTKDEGTKENDEGNVFDFDHRNLSPQEQLMELRKIKPLSKLQIAKAVELISQVDDHGLHECGLEAPPRPVLDSKIDKMPVKQRLQALQKYITAFEYNHTHDQFYNIRKNRPLSRVMDTAKEISRQGLPIKCIEAVFLGIYLTAGMTELDRIPVGFKTEVTTGECFRHIVLLVRHRPSGEWGALGLSRRSELMYKELGYSTCSRVINDYKEAYEGWGHRVLKVRVGLAVSHDPFSNQPVCWRYYAYKVSDRAWDQICDEMDRCAACPSTRLYERWLVTGKKATKVQYDKEKGGVSPAKGGSKSAARKSNKKEKVPGATRPSSSKSSRADVAKAASKAANGKADSAGGKGSAKARKSVSLAGSLNKASDPAKDRAPEGTATKCAELPGNPDADATGSASNSGIGVNRRSSDDGNGKGDSEDSPPVATAGARADDDPRRSAGGTRPGSSGHTAVTARKDGADADDEGGSSGGSEADSSSTESESDSSQESDDESDDEW